MIFGRKNPRKAGFKAYQQGDYQRALSCFERVMREASAGEADDLWPWIGTCQYELGDCWSATKSFEQAMHHAPGDPDWPIWWATAVRKLGCKAFDQDKFEEALERFTSILQRVMLPDEHLESTLLWLGICYQLLGNHPSSAQTFEQVLEWYPTNLFAKEHLSYVLSTAPDDRIRDGQRAKHLAEEILQHKADPPWRHLTLLAAAEAELGDFRSALANYERAMQIMPVDEREKRQATWEGLRRHEPIRCSPEIDRARLVKRSEK